jgi:hypothetical protein
MSLDIDGDGRPDRLHASGRTLTVRLADDPTHPLTAVVRRLAGFVGSVATGASTPAVVVATRNTPPSQRNWTAYRIADGKLVAVTVKAGTLATAGGDGIVSYGTRALSWVTRGGRLMTAVQDPSQAGQRRLLVRVESFVPDRGALRREIVGRWCWDTVSQSLPAPCPTGVSYQFDPGPHGGLPTLLPITHPALLGPGVSRTWHSAGARLRVVEGPHHVKDHFHQAYDVVGTIDGRHVSARIGVGNAFLYKTYVDLGHGVRGLVAPAYEGGPWTILSVTDLGLMRALPVGPRHGADQDEYLHPGTLGLSTAQGAPRQAATWIADGKVFTRVETGTFGRYRTYEWQVGDTSNAPSSALQPVDLGLVCMDDFQSTYGTCS